MRGPKTKEQRAVERLRIKCESLIAGHVAEAQESQLERAKRLDLFRGRYDLFFEYYFPHLAFAKTAKFQRELAEAALADEEIYAVVEWARGHAKTTHVCLGILLWLHFLHTKRDSLRGGVVTPAVNTVILVGRTEKDAQKLLYNLASELEGNQRIIADFGNQFNELQWGASQIVTLGGLCVWARGKGQNVRGLRNGANRPDYIAGDDLDDDQEVRNPKLVDKSVEYLDSAVYGTMHMGKGRMFIVGNRIHQQGIIARMAQKPGIYHSIYYAWADEAQTVPNWPECFTPEDIRKAEQRYGDKAQQELHGKPGFGTGTFQKQWFKWVEMQPASAYDSCLLYIDPSYKDSRKHDYKAAALVARRKNQFYLLDMFCRKCHFGDLVRWTYDTWDRLQREGHNVPFLMEGDLGQNNLKVHFDTYADQMQRDRLPLRMDEIRKRLSKGRRIEIMADLFRDGVVFFNSAKQEHPDMKALIEQLLNFDPNSNRVHDDGPDALQLAIFHARRMTKIAVFR